MDGHLLAETRRSRLERLLEVGAASARAFRQRYLGQTVDVLWEERRNGRWSGLTANYVRVQTVSTADLTNKLLPVRLTSIDGDCMIGELVSEAVPEAQPV
jgi:threonylcarbamoyladenosine tRNA methylthiotransferase MtaB